MILKRKGIQLQLNDALCKEETLWSNKARGHGRKEVIDVVDFLLVGIREISF